MVESVETTPVVQIDDLAATETVSAAADDASKVRDLLKQLIETKQYFAAEKREGKKNKKSYEKHGYKKRTRADRGPKQCQRRFRHWQGRQPRKPRRKERLIEAGRKPQPTSSVEDEAQLAQSCTEEAALDRLLDRCLETGAATAPGLCLTEAETVRPSLHRAPAL